MTKQSIKPLAAAMGVAFAATMAMSSITVAAENPFQADQLSSGYNLAGNHAEGKCGEGKCGEGKDSHDKDSEGKCGGDKAEGEGKCGGDKADAEGKCGGAS